MNDEMIVNLYFKRDENAVKETQKKYNAYLSNISYNILYNRQDSEECVNDTYLKAWNSIPPNKPNVLSTYLGKITRRLSIDVLRGKNRKKRKATEYDLSLDELEDCVGEKDSIEKQVDVNLLSNLINKYLSEISSEARIIFVCRYYYMDSVRAIANYYDMSESKVKSSLYRTRQGLKKYLMGEGFEL